MRSSSGGSLPTKCTVHKLHLQFTVKASTTPNSHCYTAGVKRKLASVLGSPTGTSGGTPGAAPPQTGHAPLPLQSVVNGQTSNRDSHGVPARNSGGMLTGPSLSLDILYKWWRSRQQHEAWIPCWSARWRACAWDPLPQQQPPPPSPKHCTLFL